MSIQMMNFTGLHQSAVLYLKQNINTVGASFRLFTSLNLLRDNPTLK